MAHNLRAATRGAVWGILLAATLGCAALAADHGSGGGGSSSADSSSQPQAISLINDAAQNKDIFSFDYGVPTSPALQLVSASPSKFTTSTPLKPYVLSLPASWGGSSGQDAFAADIAPSWLLDDDNTYSHYEAVNQQSPLSGLWTRLRVGGALDIGSDGNGNKSKATASKLGFGISTSLLTDSDPALTPDPDNASQTYWDGCIDKLRKTVGAKYEQQLDTKWGNALTIMAQLTAALSDAKGSQPKGGAAQTHELSAGDAQAIYRFMGRCFADAACDTLDSDGKLKALYGQASPSTGVTQAQLDDIQTAASQMQKALDAANGLLVSDFSKQITTCISNTNLLASHAPALDLGGGIEWQGTPGHASGFTQAAEVAWLGGRYPLSSIFTPNGSKKDTGDGPAMGELDYFMIGGSVRASWDELSSTGNKATPQIRANTLDAWAGLERVTSGSQFSAQIGYDDVHAISSAQSSFSKSGTRWLVSGSLKLGDTVEGMVGTLLSDFGSDQSLKNGFWLNVTYGTANGNISSLNDKTFMVSLSFSETPSNVFNASSKSDDSGGGKGDKSGGN